MKTRRQHQKPRTRRHVLEFEHLETLRLLSGAVDTVATTVGFAGATDNIHDTIANSQAGSATSLDYLNTGTSASATALSFASAMNPASNGLTAASIEANAVATATGVVVFAADFNNPNTPYSKYIADGTSAAASLFGTLAGITRFIPIDGPAISAGMTEASAGLTEVSIVANHWDTVYGPEFNALMANVKADLTDLGAAETSLFDSGMTKLEGALAPTQSLSNQASTDLLSAIRDDQNPSAFSTDINALESDFSGASSTLTSLFNAAGIQPVNIDTTINQGSITVSLAGSSVPLAAGYFDNSSPNTDLLNVMGSTGATVFTLSTSLTALAVTDQATAFNANGSTQFSQTIATSATTGQTSTSISGEGDVCTASAQTITLLSGGQATINGMNDQISCAANTTAVIASGSNDQCTATGTNVSLTVDANACTTVLEGAGDRCTATGQYESINLQGQNDQAVLSLTNGTTSTQGALDTVNEAGVNGSVTIDTSVTIDQPVDPTTGTEIVQTYGLDSSGNAVTTPTYSLSVAGHPLTAQQVASSLGSTLGSLLVGSNNFAAQIGAKSLGSALFTTAFQELGPLSTSLLNPGTSGATPLDQLTLDAIDGLAKTTLQTVGSQTASSLTSIAFAAAAQDLGLKGFAGAFFTSTGQSLETQLYQNLPKVVAQNDPSQLLDDINVASISAAIATAGGSLLGQQFASSLTGTPTSLGQSIFASLGANAGSLEGVSIATDLGSAASTFLGADAGTIASEVLCDFVLPGIGAAIGTLLGSVGGSFVYTILNDATFGLLGSLFGGGEPWAYHYFAFDPTTNQISAPASLYYTKDTTASLRGAVDTAANAVSTGVNSVLAALGGSAVVDPNAPGFDIIAYVNSSKSWGANDIQAENASNTWRMNAAGNPAAIIRRAIDDDLRQMDIVGGDPILVRAFEAWKTRAIPAGSTDSIAVLETDLQVAQDYERYQANDAAINTLMRDQPNSAYTLGWLDELSDAEVLGLNQPASRSFRISLPTTMTAGSTVAVTIEALGAHGNLDPTYTGKIAFWGGSGLASLPTSYTFTAADKGVHTFLITATVAGTHAIKVAAAGSASGQAQVNVLPAAATTFTLNQSASVVAGQPVSFTLTAYDAYGNVATNYMGTVTFKSNDTKAVLPARYTFTSSDKGSRVFTATFSRAPSRIAAGILIVGYVPPTLTVTDDSNPKLTKTLTLT
jgi:hypothetical protein